MVVVEPEMWIAFPNLAFDHRCSDQNVCKAYSGFQNV